MPMFINLRHLAVREVALKGELSVAELDMANRDSMIQITRPVQYDLVVERVNESLLLRGQVRVVLDCQCVRCLEPFRHELTLDGPLGEIPLEGEEAVAVVNDCVDLTPQLRDDIFLAFPSHPVCQPECGGLSVKSHNASSRTGTALGGVTPPSVWDQLNKLNH